MLCQENHETAILSEKAGEGETGLECGGKQSGGKYICSIYSRWLKHPFGIESTGVERDIQFTHVEMPSNFTAGF